MPIKKLQEDIAIRLPEVDQDPNHALTQCVTAFVKQIVDGSVYEEDVEKIAALTHVLNFLNLKPKNIAEFSDVYKDLFSTDHIKPNVVALETIGKCYSMFKGRVIERTLIKNILGLAKNATKLAVYGNERDRIKALVAIREFLQTPEEKIIKKIGEKIFPVKFEETKKTTDDLSVFLSAIQMFSTLPINKFKIIEEIQMAILGKLLTADFSIDEARKIYELISKVVLSDGHAATVMEKEVALKAILAFVKEAPEEIAKIGRVSAADKAKLFQPGKPGMEEQVLFRLDGLCPEFAKYIFLSSLKSSDTTQYSIDSAAMPTITAFAKCLEVGSYSPDPKVEDVIVERKKVVKKKKTPPSTPTQRSGDDSDLSSAASAASDSVVPQESSNDDSAEERPKTRSEEYPRAVSTTPTSSGIITPIKRSGGSSGSGSPTKRSSDSDSSTASTATPPKTSKTPSPTTQPEETQTTHVLLGAAVKLVPMAAAEKRSAETPQSQKRSGKTSVTTTPSITTTPAIPRRGSASAVAEKVSASSASATQPSMRSGETSVRSESKASPAAPKKAGLLNSLASIGSGFLKKFGLASEPKEKPKGPQTLAEAKLMLTDKIKNFEGRCEILKSYEGASGQSLVSGKLAELKKLETMRSSIAIEDDGARLDLYKGQIATVTRLSKEVFDAIKLEIAKQNKHFETLYSSYQDSLEACKALLGERYNAALVKPVTEALDKFLAQLTKIGSAKSLTERKAELDLMPAIDTVLATELNGLRREIDKQLNNAKTEIVAFKSVQEYPQAVAIEALVDKCEQQVSNQVVSQDVQKSIQALQKNISTLREDFLAASSDFKDMSLYALNTIKSTTSSILIRYNLYTKQLTSLTEIVAVKPSLSTQVAKISERAQLLNPDAVANVTAELQTIQATLDQSIEKIGSKELEIHLNSLQGLQEKISAVDKALTLIAIDAAKRACPSEEEMDTLKEQCADMKEKAALFNNNDLSAKVAQVVGEVESALASFKAVLNTDVNSLALGELYQLEQSLKALPQEFDGIRLKFTKQNNDLKAAEAAEKRVSVAKIKSSLTADLTQRIEELKKQYDQLADLAEPTVQANVAELEAKIKSFDVAPNLAMSLQDLRKTLSFVRTLPVHVEAAEEMAAKLHMLIFNLAVLEKQCETVKTNVGSLSNKVEASQKIDALILNIAKFKAEILRDMAQPNTLGGYKVVLEEFRLTAREQQTAVSEAIETERDGIIAKIEQAMSVVNTPEFDARLAELQTTCQDLATLAKPLSDEIINQDIAALTTRLDGLTISAKSANLKDASLQQFREALNFVEAIPAKAKEAESAAAALKQTILDAREVKKEALVAEINAAKDSESIMTAVADLKRLIAECKSNSLLAIKLSSFEELVQMLTTFRTQMEESLELYVTDVAPMFQNDKDGIGKLQKHLDKINKLPKVAADFLDIVNAATAKIKQEDDKQFLATIIHNLGIVIGTAFNKQTAIALMDKFKEVVPELRQVHALKTLAAEDKLSIYLACAGMDNPKSFLKSQVNNMVGPLTIIKQRLAEVFKDKKINRELLEKSPEQIKAVAAILVKYGLAAMIDWKDDYMRYAALTKAIEKAMTAYEDFITYLVPEYVAAIEKENIASARTLLQQLRKTAADVQAKGKKPEAMSDEEIKAQKFVFFMDCRRALKGANVVGADLTLLTDPQKIMQNFLDLHKPPEEGGHPCQPVVAVHIQNNPKKGYTREAIKQIGLALADTFTIGVEGLAVPKLIKSITEQSWSLFFKPKQTKSAFAAAAPPKPTEEKEEQNDALIAKNNAPKPQGPGGSTSSSS